MSRTKPPHPVTTTPDGWFVLNPNAPFKLHVRGLDADAVARLQRALQRGMNLIQDAEEPVLRTLARAAGFTCREIDGFQADAVPTFQTAVQQRLAESAEWAELLLKGDAAVNRRRQLLGAVEEQVIRQSGETFRYIPALLSEDAEVRRRTIVSLLCHTYVMAQRQRGHAARYEDLGSSIRGWTYLTMPGGCCPTCKSIPAQLPPQPRPVVPVHVACGCSVHPVFAR